VDLVGNELLACAALPLEQHREIGQSDTLDALPERLHRRGRAKERYGAISAVPTRGTLRARHLEDEPAQLRGGCKQLEVLLVEPPARSNDASKTAWTRGSAVGTLNTIDSAVRVGVTSRA